MATVAGTRAKIAAALVKYGEPVTVSKASGAYGATDSDELALRAIITRREVTIGDTHWPNALVAKLPHTDLELDGTKLVRASSGEEYTVKSFNQKFLQGQLVFQEVILT